MNAYVEPSMTPELADFRARCLVNGYGRHDKSEQIEPVSGGWSSRFKTHPWVQAADAEGWAKELRMSCIAAARDRIMKGVKPNDIQPEDVMPRSEYVEHWRSEALRARQQAEWRRANPNHPTIKGLIEIEPVEFLRRLGVNRPE